MNLKIHYAHSAFDFVGFKLFEGNPNLFLPYGLLSKPSDKDFKKNAFNLLRSIDKSKKQLSNFSSQIFNSNNLFGEYTWLINDFIKNGIVKTLIKEINSKFGERINWKKTIQNNKSLEIKNDGLLNLLYDKNFQTNNYLSRIHRYCLSQAYKKIGWLYGSLPIVYLDEDTAVIKRYIKYLRRYFINIHNDKSKYFVKVLIKILLENSDQNDDEIYEVGTYNFHIIWENIIDNIFGNTNVQEYLPYANYKIKNKLFRANSKMYPDTIYINKNFYLIDAKYYNFGKTNKSKDLPATSDIQKQILYANYVKSSKYMIDPYKKLFNIFIIPIDLSDKNSEVPEAMKKDMMYSIGYAFNDWETHGSNDKINVLLLDLKSALKIFLHNSNEARSKLVTLQLQET